MKKNKSLLLWILINVVTFFILFFTFDIYSSLLDEFGLGNSKRSGLHFLLIWMVTLPVLIVIGGIKWIIFKNQLNLFSKLLSFFIALILCVPILVDETLNKTTLWFGIGMVIISLILTIIDIITFLRKKRLVSDS